MRARAAIFGTKVSLYHTQIKYIYSSGCHAHFTRKLKYFKYLTISQTVLYRASKVSNLDVFVFKKLLVFFRYIII